MSTTPPNKPRRRIAGEAKPGDVPTKPAKAPKAPKVPKTAKVTPSPAAGLPKAPARSDAPKVAKVPKLAKPVKAAVPTPDSSGPAPVSAAARSLSLGTWALIGLTVAALVFAVTGAIAGVRHWQGDDATVAREGASDAAAAAAETIFTYQWNRLKQHQSASQDLMTPRFAKKFESIAPALTALAPQRKIQVKAVTRDAAAIECGDKCVENRVKVLVFVDQARLADGLEKPTVFGNRVEMSMVKRDGDWLVDDVKAL